MLEHALHAPETAARDHGGLDAIGGLNVRGGSGDDHGVFRSQRGCDDESSDRQRADGGGAERKAAELAAGHGLPLGVGGFDGSLERQRRSQAAPAYPMSQDTRWSGYCYRPMHTSS